MRVFRVAAVLLAFALSAVLVLTGRTPESKGGGPRPDERPRELAEIDIAEKPGALLPRELVFTDTDGKKAPLGSYLEGGRPLVVVLAYYRCPMLCSVVLNGLLDGMKGLEWSAGKEYDLAVVSFDPRDTVEIAAAKRATYVAKYARPTGERGIHFLVGDEKDVKTLADRVGFHYKWDPKQEQYAHAAGAFVFNRDGALSRTLYGINFPPETVRLALTEAADGKLGSAWDKVILFCFHYDPQTRKYTASAWRVMRLGGACTLLALGLFLGALWRRKPGPGIAPSSSTPTDWPSQKRSS